MKRKTHRNRYSITHLSSETTATLPEYADKSTAWQHQQHQQPHQQHIQRALRMLDPELEGLPYDRPPDYSNSADEADEETDSVSGDGLWLFGGSTISLPQLPAASLHAAAPSPRCHIKRHSSSISPPSHYLNSYTHHHYHHTHLHRNPLYQPHRPCLQHRRYKSSVVLPSPTDDPYLDSLLERSIHALEMSNTLLQSSISTRTSLSALLKTPVIETMDGKPFKEVGQVEQLEERIMGLTKRTNVHEKKREQWVDDLEKIKKDMERLFGDGDGNGNEGGEMVQGRQKRQKEEIVIDIEETSNEGELAVGRRRVSCSLPSSSSMPARPTSKRPLSQLDLQPDASLNDHRPRLVYSPQYRSRLVAPAPRAITQYAMASSAEPEFITLPSTLGTRTPSTFLQHSSASASTVSLHASPLIPQITDKLPEPTTPAYNMLASFVHRTPTMSSSTPSSVSSSSVLASFMPKVRRRASSSAATISGSDIAGPCGRSKRRLLIDNPHPELMQAVPSGEASRGRTPRCGMSPLTHRPMTPPTEESTGSSSSESLIAKQTIMSLRKILDEQTARSELVLDVNEHVRHPLKAPAFLPVTPPPVPLASTSNATASISQLFTKGIHTSSTRLPSPPKHSILKHASGSHSSISAETSTSSVVQGSSNSSGAINMAKGQWSMLPELVTAGVAKAFGVKPNGANSAPSSGQSTPKRISFAELPEVSRLEGRPSKFKEKQQQQQAQRRWRKLGQKCLALPLDGATEREHDNRENERGDLAERYEAGSPPNGGGWWSGWLGDGAGGIGDALAGMGAGSGGMYVSRYEERMEDRLNRSWGRVATAPGLGGGIDGWAV